MRVLLLLFFTLYLRGAEVLWGPYLQDVRADRATISWATTGEPGGNAVDCFLPSGWVEVQPITVGLPASQTGLAQHVWLHRATIGGLNPRTHYQYALRVGGRLIEDPRQVFTTAGTLPFRFLAIGDTGDNGAGQRQLAQILEGETADFLLHTGDIAYWEGTFQQFHDAYFNIYERLLKHTPVFPTLGNHDATFDSRAYRTLLQEQLYYSFDWSNVHVTVIDSNQSFATGSPMREWLEQDLRNTRQTWRIVSIHHPPFPTSGYKRDDEICKQVARELTPVFERNGVHLLLAGHEHIYQRTQPRSFGEWRPQGPGTLYVTTGGGGSQNYEAGRDAFVAASWGAGHYMRVTVTETALRLEAVDNTGVVVDRAEILPDPVLLPGGIRNAASHAEAVAPGGLVTLYGWNLEQAVASDGERRWPILYNGRTQINAQAPFELSGRVTVRLRTPHGTAQGEMDIAALAPGVFGAVRQNGAVVGPGVPVVPGEWISIFATGLGRVRGGQVTGVPAPLSPLRETEAAVRATINGQAMEASPAVLAPGYVGLYQINARIPGGMAAGMYPLLLSVQGQASNSLSVEVR
jgi:acid phosphatase type 7